MQRFTGIQYLAIDIANQFGMDKHNWNERIDWVRANRDKLEDFIDAADDKMMYIKAVKSFRKAEKGEPIGHMMGLDCTASGYQVMSALSGCHKSAANVNLINTGERMDLYTSVANHMNESLLPSNKVDRSNIKKPVMVTAYGSRKEPEEIFGEDTEELKEFNKTLNNKLSGAIDVMDLIRDCWDPDKEEHCWTLPDGHKVVLRSVVKKSNRIETEDYRFTYIHDVVEGHEDGTNLIANVN